MPVDYLVNGGVAGVSGQRRRVRAFDRVKTERSAVMSSGTYAAPSTVGTVWLGRAMSGLAALFVLVDGVMKVIQPSQVVESMAELGFSERATMGIGILAIACVAIYLYPRTAMVGVVLLTGFLGGAVASQVRIDAGLFPIVFPLIMGALLWAGLYLRDARPRLLLQYRD
jgi:hypothetical protein